MVERLEHLNLVNQRIVQWAIAEDPGEVVKYLSEPLKEVFSKEARRPRTIIVRLVSCSGRANTPPQKKDAESVDLATPRSTCK